MSARSKKKARRKTSSQAEFWSNGEADFGGLASETLENRSQPVEPIQDPSSIAQDEEQAASGATEGAMRGKLELPGTCVPKLELGNESQSTGKDTGSIAPKPTVAAPALDPQVHSHVQLGNEDQLQHERHFQEVVPAEPPPATTPNEPRELDTKPGRSLVISIHDVSQHTRPAVERILAELEALGVHGACSLLVVPDLHRRGIFLDDPVFCNWLKERAIIGDEVVIHGYHHCRNPHPGESLREKLTTRFYTKGEGEFFDVQGADALRIVNEARQELRTLGIGPRGFIAPAWLLSDGAECALRVLKIDYTTRLTSVDDLISGQRYRSQTLVWSVRALWRRVVSLGWNAFLFRRLLANPLMRISIHPTDIEHRAVWRQILKLTRLALVNRAPISYLKWVETSRHSPHAIQS